MKKEDKLKENRVWWNFMCNIIPMSGLAKIAAQNCTLKAVHTLKRRHIISLRAPKLDASLYTSNILGSIRQAFENAAGAPVQIMICFEDKELE